MEKQDIPEDINTIDKLFAALPASLQENEDVKAYYRNLYEMVDAYAVMMEELIQAQKNSPNDGEDLAMEMQGLQSMMSFAQKMKPLSERMSALKAKFEGIKKELTVKEARKPN